MQVPPRTDFKAMETIQGQTSDCELQSMVSSDYSECTSYDDQSQIKDDVTVDFASDSEYEYNDETLAISYATLLMLSAFSNLFCWPIGMVTTWKILTIRDRGDDINDTEVSDARLQVRYMLYHAYGWGIVLAISLMIVVIVQLY